MNDINARHLIEALRSGIPSIAVGSYFTEARPQLLKKISASLETVAEEGASEGMIITGRYGEGKTHLLNTLFSMAHADNMVVSIIPLSKEIPMHKLPNVYQNLMNSTYLPGRNQPGFMTEVEARLKDTEFANDLLFFFEYRTGKKQNCLSFKGLYQRRCTGRKTKTTG